MSYVISRPADASAAYMPIWAPLLAFNQSAVGDAEGVPLALTLTDDENPTVQGGLWALSLWGSLYIALVVVPDGLRGRGLGRDLMRQAEAEARLRGCGHMWLDTYAFQARLFYEGLGFEVFGRIDGPPPVFPRFFMQKHLRDA